MNALDRARLSLNGLSVGDAFGEQLFIAPSEATRQIEEHRLPAPPWRYTDDTEMAISVVAILKEHGGIDQTALVKRFAERCDPQRGYGPTTRGLLARIQQGESWESAARSLFGGSGSHGNGAAMRAAPIGGYFADDLEAVVYQARLSAEVTHQHPEGIAGAIAVAVAGALAWQMRADTTSVSGSEFLYNVRVRSRWSGERENPPCPQLASGCVGQFGCGRAWQWDRTFCPGYRALCPLVCGPTSRQLSASTLAHRKWIGRPRHHLRHRGRDRSPARRPGRFARTLAPGPRASARLNTVAINIESNAMNAPPPVPCRLFFLLARECEQEHGRRSAP